MDVEKNGASFQSSDGSIGERVAPEPASSTEAPVLMEASTSGNEEPVFHVDFHIENGQTEVTVEGADQEMLLFDLTLAFNETGVRFAPYLLSLSLCLFRILLQEPTLVESSYKCEPSRNQLQRVFVVPHLESSYLDNLCII